MEMCRFFENFDRVDCKIIVFEVKRKKIGCVPQGQ